MKVDHCKNQGATMFDFEKPIVKLQVEIRANNPSHDLCKRADATLALAREWSQKMIMKKIPRGGVGRIRRYYSYRIRYWGWALGGPGGPGGPWRGPGGPSGGGPEGALGPGPGPGPSFLVY